MAEITVSLIKTLRDKTNGGMMDCKAALVEADGDLEAAETILRKKGIVDADKKAGRAASEGVVASRILADGKAGILAAVNCETDFVAKNDNFRDFVEAILDHIEASPSVDSVEALLAQDYAGDAATLEEFIKIKVGELGENMGLARFAKYEVSDNGGVGTYIHMAGRVGVLVELTCENAATASTPEFGALAKDICMHIAAAQPICVSSDEVPSELVEKEKDIFREQMKDKPAEIIEKIIGGKMGKFYATNCLLDQAFIKDGDKTVQGLIDEVSAAAGDKIAVARFDRFGVGEEVEAEA
ncbi:translation elongation factor Ts [Verrucomicrobiales bacterium BCK34]|nr:translation elongation factor Ts [Verrucomicrobiales bacterium BCK34]